MSKFVEPYNCFHIRDAKRLEEWGEWMRETLLLDVPHRQVVFVIPKMLRIFFKYNRRLLGEFCRSALRSLSGGAMKVIAFITDYAVIDKIINHLKLTFVADRPPPPHIAYQEILITDETSADYFS